MSEPTWEAMHYPEEKHNHWEIREHNPDARFEDDHRIIAKCRCEPDEARLIAAAPTLLEACLFAHEYVVCLRYAHGREECRDILEAAIKKAREGS